MNSTFQIPNNFLSIAIISDKSTPVMPERNQHTDGKIYLLVYMGGWWIVSHKSGPKTVLDDPKVLFRGGASTSRSNLFIFHVGWGWSPLPSGKSWIRHCGEYGISNNERKREKKKL